MWFRSHQALSVRPLVRHSWISSIHSWSERLGCLWTILVQLLCCVLWVYWTSNTSLWTKLVQCLNSLGLEWLSHELAGMERRWVIQRLLSICKKIMCPNIFSCHRQTFHDLLLCLVIQKRCRNFFPHRSFYSNIKFSTSLFVNSAFGCPITSSVRPVSTNFPSSMTAISSQNQRTTSRSWEMNR